MPNSNLVIIPEEVQKLDKEILSKLLIPEENIDTVNVKQLGKKRLRELLYHKPLPSHKTNHNDIIDKLKDPSTLLLSVKELNHLLNYYDTFITDWHINRGLPKELGMKSDVIVLTHEELLTGTTKHLQDFCSLGFKKNG